VKVPKIRCIVVSPMKGIRVNKDRITVVAQYDIEPAGKV
jgi:hypothetical protein